MPEAFIARQTLEKCQEIARRWPENTLVVRLNGKIVGFSCYGTDDSGAGEVFAIYLLKEAQGLGLGRKLSRLGRRSPVTLWVLENNDPAIGFYEHYGFRMDGAQKGAPFGTECRMTYLRA